MSKRIEIKALTENRIRLKLAGRTSLGEGRRVSAELNREIAYFNTVLGTTATDDPKKIKAETSTVLTDYINARSKG